MTTDVRIERGTSVEDVIPFIEAEPPVETHLPQWQIDTIKAMNFKVTVLDDEEEQEEEVVEDEQEDATDETPAETEEDQIEETSEEEGETEEDLEVEEDEESSELTITEEDIQRLGSISSWKDLESFVSEKLDTTLEALGLTKEEGYTLKSAKAYLEEQLT